MRLSAEQVLILKQTTRQHFGEKVCVLLFGSRTDDTARGGDIDLLIAPPPEAPANASRQSLAHETALQVALGDQKFDILPLNLGCTETPTHRITKQTGTAL